MVVFIDMVAILMMSAKLDALTLFETKVFWKKGYDVIIYVYDVTNNILSRDSNCILDEVIDQSFVTLAFLWDKLSWPQFYKDLSRKNFFLIFGFWFKFNTLGLAIGMVLSFHQYGKKVKTKSQKVLGG